MQGGQPIEQHSTGEAWDTRRHGMEQLAQLNAMERGQDTTTWSTNAIHSATNGVLVVAAIAALNHPDWWILLISLSILGTFISTSWFLIILRAHRYEVEWLQRARWLQDRLRVPPQCAIWQGPSSEFRPVVKGISSQKVLRVLISGFYFMWVATIIIAVQYGTLSCGEKSLYSVLTTIISLTAYMYFFGIQMSRVDSFNRALQDSLGLPRPRKGK